ncbi:PREDICTED: FTS and Hook-interacting protein [Crocodylus porosus]|uniref:FHF complex subunit HOOK-interacting protein 1B n=1 Tax=Crocodylus porosus TaxID=8502 RepID=A0A7M4G299_CROPO|nr:PREDICTED: FTS and Hook-interacting protein [Crocodylus porosus]
MDRMSWLSKLNPRAAAGHRPSRGPGLQSPVAADPETCLMVFKNHWAQVLRILEPRGAGQGSADDQSAVRNHTHQLLQLLAEERARAGGAPGPILEFVLAEDLLERLLRWHVAGDFGEERRAEQLKLYEVLLGQARQPLLRHAPVLRPLLRLLGLCAATPAAPALQASLVLLLSQLCVCVAREPGLLECFFYRPPSPGADPGSGPADLLLFSLLVPFVHHEGVTGQQARDALLLIMAMSASNCTVASYITDHSYFCPVLATGLSALYSSLPRKIEVRGDDWHFLRREDWAGVASLALFMNSLEFCSAVIQVAHPLVQQQLVDYVHNGFLVPVMGPALHKTSVEEMIASTAYLELFVRSVAEPALLRAFLRFILLHRHDGATILDTLVARLGTNSRLCMVSLSLFRTLLSLNCEDVMLQLVLRYLIPCSHVMLSQRRAVRDLDLYGRSAAKFLSLIPRCCHPESLPPPERDEEHAAWAKGHGSPSVDTSSVVTVPKPATPSRLSFFMRQQSAGGAEGLGAVPRSPGLASPASSPGHRPARWEEVAELDGNYLEYLRDARLSVDRCAWACRVWSAPYDGERPGPDSLVPMPAPALPISPDHFGHGPPTPRTKKRGLPEEAGGSAAGPGDSQPLPAPDARDPGALVNGAAESGRPGGGVEGAVTVKKVRRCPQSEREALPAENGAPQPPAPGWEGPSVDSLLDELLARAPAEPNGAGLSIESFSEELRELEAAMRNGGGGLPRAQLPPPHAEEDEAEDEDEAFAAPPRPADPLAQVLASPPRALGPPPSQPFTGPFVAVLFSKLENMLHNSLYVNVLLTGLVAQLACYPQPLLRSFLLNANMVFQPSVKSLLQVLGSVKNKIESFAAGQDDFPALLLKAKKYLIARGKLDWGDTPNAAPALRRSDTLVKSRKPSLGELLLRHTQSPTRARAAAQLALQQVREGPVLQALAGAGLFRGAAEKQGEALRVKNAVYCAVVFTEFLKELAAIAQAHAVTSPFLLEPPEE